MIEAKIDTGELDKLLKKLEDSPKRMEEIRRKAFEEAAPEAKRLVDAAIRSALKGDAGKVQDWQSAYVGSRGGYAAVRPKKDTWTEATKKKGNRYAVGAVTNAIVSGHRFPSPSGRKYYRSRIQISAQRVPGRPFYSDAEPAVMDLAKKTAEKIASELLRELEG